MDSDTVIKVDGLYKKFASNLKRSMIYGSVDLARNFIGFPTKQEKLRKSEFWALENINFELKRGESLGLIGRNGSGKSTLLRVLTGIFPPDKGSVSMKGRVGALIALGAGFHPHMTGRENVFLNGTILGMNSAEIKRKFDEIVDFAEVADFIDAPVSTYSSGMKVRLGFSIAVQSVPDILLVDEVLSVGDMSFRQKSMSKMSEILSSGRTIIFVSHDMLSVERVTDRCLLLEKGQLLMDGPTPEVVTEYFRLNTTNPFEDERSTVTPPVEPGVTLKKLRVMNAAGEETRDFKSGEKITIEWAFNTEKPLYDVNAYCAMADGPMTWNGYLSHNDGIKIERLDSQTNIRFTMDELLLAPGKYSLDIGLWDEKFLKPYYWDYKTTGSINIHPGGAKILKRFMLPHSWEIS